MEGWSSLPIGCAHIERSIESDRDERFYRVPARRGFGEGNSDAALGARVTEGSVAKARSACAHHKLPWTIPELSKIDD
jgi:hypothetical protein